MIRCLQLAELAAGDVAPNPMVGAVLVHERRIIGEGYHKIFGGPHAEVNCIADAEQNLKREGVIDIARVLSSSVMYVSLEPCSHFGKTPPCVDLIVSKGIQKVVIGAKDIFEKVNGSGIQKLHKSGCEVITGVCEHDATQLNRRFNTFYTKQRPYIILKWAQSRDGFIGRDDLPNYPVSNSCTNMLVHRWRGEEAAIMVGTNTALIDNPSLTTRHWPGKNPVRVVIDKELKIPESSKLFDEQADTIIFNTLKTYIEGRNRFVKLDAQNFLDEIVNTLYDLQILSLIVEGGSKLLQSFIDADLWDEARVITNTALQIGSGTKAPYLNGNVVNSYKIIDDDVKIYTTR
jgi:diaminohydroxyphosphoribosylaminopyrimidine deaminase / 5-amino-6-(5-phosphoribosylamino)uracil reductase